ncbi:unnamed protein product [Moneuplotes crassus]|uniref:S1/P1 Nuclease n=1 Tax=Euplotes crassus TaxID=5936 RepID=A0AAD1XPX1_EUPCR|nr:unnamed protein product [Moneuplotes crassus]
MKGAIFTLILVLACISSSYAFWSTGHMIISRIAYEQLKEKNETLYNLIEEDIKLLQEFSVEVNHSFVEAAIWADDNKEIAFNQFTEWHYANTPVILPDFEGEILSQPQNVTWGINEMVKTLSYTKTPKFNNSLALSFSWRYLLHLIGDIHQPLHASTMFSAQFPDGDMGGNLFMIDYEAEDMNNLHSLWDASVDQYGSIWAPLSDDEWTSIGEFADSIMKMYPRESVQARVDITDPRVWAKESFNLAKEVVYSDLKSGDKITPEYLKIGRKAVNEQLAVGGYRLADALLNLAQKRYSESIIKQKLQSS